MNIPPWIYNPWFIVLATVILILVVKPLLSSLANRLRALQGDFSGFYLALTVHSQDNILVEIAEGQHIGSRFKGKIRGVCFVGLLKDGELVELGPNVGKYRFDGTSRERLLVLSYHPTIKGLKGSGTLTLEADSSGRHFIGIWAGFSMGIVASSLCIWARIDDKLASSATCETLVQEIKKVLSWHGFPTLASEKLKGTGTLMVNPHFGLPRKPVKSADLFVLMPFKADLEPVYTDHIADVTATLGLTTARADDFFTARPVMLDIWDAIWAARAVIADCTGRNPNVFYEIGLVHVIGKPVILITQNSEDVPFDLRHLRYILYEFTPQGMKLFEQRLTETLKTELGLEGEERD